MWRYLKAAFNIRPEIPGLGRLPVNWMAVACFAILGIGHPAFWLLGFGLDLGFVTMLASHKKFQKYVDALKYGRPTGDIAAQRRTLVEQLPTPYRSQMADLERKRDRILTLNREARVDQFAVENNRDALEALLWLYLKLLIAKHNLQSHDGAADEESLAEQIGALDRDLKSTRLSQSLRESKTATLAILRKRLAHLKRREETLVEIDSDLRRIEAQFDLARDHASLQGEPQLISTNIKLASHLLDDVAFGDAHSTVAAVDQEYRQRERAIEH